MEDKDISNRLTLSYYKELSVLDDDHGIFIVQHIETRQLYVKKKAAIFSKPVYEQLKNNPVPGVPRTIEIIESGEELIIIEEHISGRNLAEILASDGPISREKVVDYCIKLCDILTGLHSLKPPVIHRDIKPSNVILTEDGRIVLIDMDGAKLARNDESRDTHLIGSTGFAAPEQYGFASSNVQTDIYGMGKLMVALLTDDTDIKNVSDRGMNVIIKKCLQMDPSKRFRLAGQLKHALNLQRPLVKVVFYAITILLLILIVILIITSISGISKKAENEQTLIYEETKASDTGSQPESIAEEKNAQGNFDFNEITDKELASAFNDYDVANSMEAAIQSDGTEPSADEVIDMTDAIGAYIGDDKEKLVIRENGLAYYYCIDPSFIEVECPWEEKDGVITIKLSKMHCDISAEVEDNDYSELIFKSDSVNWNSEVFDKISSDPDKYIISPPKSSSAMIPVRDNGDLVIDIGSFRFLVPKQFRDLGDLYNNSNRNYALVDINADEYFTASAVFALSDISGADIESKSSQLSKAFASQFLNNLQVGYSDKISVAGQDAYRTSVSGLYNEGFSKLSNQIVSGSVILINDPSTNNILYLLLVQTVGTKTDDTDAYKYILEEATIR